MTKGSIIKVRQLNGEVVLAKVIVADAVADSVTVEKVDGVITDVYRQRNDDRTYSAIYGD